MNDKTGGPASDRDLLEMAAKAAGHKLRLIKAQDPVAFVHADQLKALAKAGQRPATCAVWNKDFALAGSSARVPLYAAPVAKQVVVPAGWQLVQVEPTKAIRDAINLLCDDLEAFDDSDAFWRYLLAASTAPGDSQ